ncbi:unnamed protein product [Caenorhabditis bovis]|uniref:Uncharacterized protein n=1 Tax=Caenorhabditis bovis TaxID=2654633 RepID=A0A8S1EG20_9PELO|nr:unnamed protein product [Caenorhabditis bovis]
MSNVPPEEEYETDTIFSQEGEVSENYLKTKLYDLDSDSEVVGGFSTELTNDQLAGLDDMGVPVHRQSNLDKENGGIHFIVDDPLPISQLTFQQLSQRGFGDAEGDLFDNNEDLYDLTQDSFRYGRVSSGASYNIVTGKMKNEILEQVKKSDEINDTKVTVDENTHTVTTEVSINLGDDGDVTHENLTFEDLYAEQVPKYFDYMQKFPEVTDVWTLFFDNKSYEKMTTFDIQTCLCAALNSKHLMLLCIGVDNTDQVTGIEMSARERVTFRLALTRAVVSEFQPPLVKLPPNKITGVSAMKRDIAELTSIVDVLFVPVFGGPGNPELSEIREGEAPKRFVIIIRLKKVVEEVFQLSSGRIFFEENGQVSQLNSLDEAARVLLKNEIGEKPLKGSLFKLENYVPEKNDEIFDDEDIIEVFEKSTDDEEEKEQIEVEERLRIEVTENTTEFLDKQLDSITEDVKTVSNTTESIWKHFKAVKNKKTAIAWALFGVAFTYTVIRATKKSS